MDSEATVSGKKIFISYTHEQPEHNGNVRSLAARLHEEGFDIEIDVFRKDDAEAWELWMRKAISRADFVLVVCTERYRNRFEHTEEQGSGLGAKWEGAIISQALYETESLNRKFVPIAFNSVDVDNRPDVLRGATYYLLDSVAAFEKLLRYLHNAPEFVLGPRGRPRNFTSQTAEPLRFSDEIEAISSPPTGNEVHATSPEQTIAIGAARAAPASGLQTSIVPAPFDPSKRYIYIPFAKKGDQVIGRSDELQAVRAQLVTGKPTSIGQTAAFHGLGGLGKTQLAIEYAYRYADDYRGGVFWFNADQDIEVQLTELAVVAGWVSPLSEHRDKLELARHQIRTRPTTLLVFDNVEERSAIEPYLPAPGTAAHILITSRLLVPGFNEVPLALLGEDEALEMLLCESGTRRDEPIDYAGARAVVRALDRLPLAIELAGAYLLHRPIGWAAYLHQLESAPRMALPGKFLSSFTRHEADLFKTLHVSDEIIAEEPLLQPVLDLLTWSGTAPMGIELMAAVLTLGAGEQLSPALAHGVKLKLLQQTPGAQRFSLHRLVREVRREEVPLTTLTPSSLEVMARLARWFEEHREDITDLATYEAEIDHLKAWEIHATAASPALAARLIWLQAYPPFHRGNGMGVKTIIQRALDVLPSGGAGAEALHAHLLNDLGWGENATGNRDRARELFEQAYTIRRERCLDQPGDIASSMINVASVIARSGEFERALSLTEEALAMCTASFGADHPATIDALSALADAHAASGNATEALSCSTAALALCQSRFGDRHHRTGHERDSLGSRLLGTNEPEQALNEFREAHDILLERLGERHHEYAATLGHLALAYHGLGQFEKALEFGERSLALVEEIVGERSPGYVVALQNFGAFLSSSGDPQRGLPLLERALMLKKSMYGTDNPDTAYTETALASSYLKLGDLTRAEEHARRALAGRETALGEAHPLTAASQEDLAIILLERKPEEAVSFLRAAVVTLRKRLGVTHDKTLRAERKLAAWLHKGRDYRGALAVLEETLSALPRGHGSRRVIEREIATVRGALPKRGSNFTPPRKKRRR